MPRVQARAKKNRDELLKFKRRETGDMHATLESWDHAYYLMKYKNKTFEVDEGKIEEYFPLEHVKANIMEI